MRTFHRVDERGPKIASAIKAPERLPIGQSIAVMAELSVLSWGAITLIAVALRTIV